MLVREERMSGPKRSGAPSRKGHLPSGDLIALGNKPSGAKSSLRALEEAKLVKPASSTGPATSSGVPAPKRAKLAPTEATGLFSDPIRVSQVSQSQTGSAKPSSLGIGAVTSGKLSPHSSGGTGPGSAVVMTPMIDVPTASLVSSIREALAGGNDVRAAKILSGGLNKLKLSRLKPDATLNSALVTLVGEEPELFSSPSAVEGLVAVLKKELPGLLKAKSSGAVYVLAVQILLKTLKDSYNWPESVAKVYVDDALGDRVWVDLEPCKKLVDNICTIFQTRPYLGSGSSTGTGPTPGSSLGSKVTSSGETSSGSGQSGLAEGAGETGLGGDDLAEDVEVEPRFPLAVCKSLKTYALQLVNDQLGRHGITTEAVSRNMLKFLTATCGLSEIRLLVAQKIEGWIQNPKVGKHCQDLLMTVAVNCHGHSAEDVHVIEALVNVRLKTKLFSSQFVSCMKELISSHPSNLETVLRGVVNNELGGQLRSPSNMVLISMMIHTWPDESAKLLGAVFQEFLARKEDYLRALRGFLREVLRQVRSEFSFPTFARSLMQERSDPPFTQLEQAHKERMALSLADLISASSMLTATMLIREAYNGHAKGERAMVSQLREFFSNLGLIQRDAVWWVHTTLPGMLRPQPADYRMCLRKVLFLEPAEAYHGKDNWPPESDRSLIFHMMTEACLMEDTLMRVLVVGLTRELPLTATDALDIADRLVARAASAHSEDIPRLPMVERRELFNAIFDITAYRQPANIQLPEQYQAPTLAISKLYWKGWVLLLVLAAFNPKTIGAIGWSEYPTLRGMMEMAMTNIYSFPSSTALAASQDGSVQSRDHAITRELQRARSEKESILEYENHLAAASSSQPAAASITESNSFLLNQVTLLHPKGTARRLPNSVIDLVKSVNRSLKLGRLLCQCRSPDFLLDVVKRQGTLESMKWLTDLVESSHSSLEVLPTPCLCEFLMASYQEQGGAVGEGEVDSASHRAQYKRKRSAKEKVHERHKQLLQQLRTLLFDSQATPQSSAEVLEYFFDKLTLSQLTLRKLALKALKEIFGSGSGTGAGESEEEERLDGDWLVADLPTLPHFSAIIPRLCHLLLQACLVETSLSCLCAYFVFVTRHTPRELLFESSIGISQIVIDRFDILRKLFQRGPDWSEVVRQKGGTGCASDEALGSLIKMLRDALEVAMVSQSTPPRSNEVDFFMLTFTDGKNAVLHSALIQAIFLLLTCDPPLNQTDFDYLLNTWFPEDSLALPQAYALESGDTVSLTPVFVLKSMLYSPVPRVVGVAVKEASALQLCGFIELCGVSIHSVDRILEKLDTITVTGDDVIREVVRNPSSLCRLVEVQILRGAKFGSVFLSLLQTMASLPLEGVVNDVFSLLVEDVHMEDALPPSVRPSHREVPTVPLDNTKQLLVRIFAPSLDRIPLAESALEDFEEALVALVSSKLVHRDTQVSPDVGGVVYSLHRLVTVDTQQRAFIEGLIKSKFSLTLFRLIAKILSLDKTDDETIGLFKATIKYLLSHMDSYRGLNRTDLLVFGCVLRSSAEQLGVKSLPDSMQGYLKAKSLSQKVQREISTLRYPFESEAVLIKHGKHLLDCNAPVIEEVVTWLARKAIVTGKESNCIGVLDKLQALACTSRPIALQTSPEVFGSGEQHDLTRSGDTALQSAATTKEADSISSSPASVDINGLFVDWLALLDPEILALSSSSLRNVFGQSRCGTPPSVLGSGQGYLLARLVHTSSWPTIARAIVSLLEAGNHKEWLNPSAVLDFLWACLHNPYLWRGRVRKEAVVSSCLSLGIDEESRLELVPAQLECLADYVLSEAALGAGVRPTSMDTGPASMGTRPSSTGVRPTSSGGLAAMQEEEKEEEQDIPQEAKVLLQSRLSLLMCCCHGNQRALASIVKHLQKHSSYPSLAWQLMVQLYLADERVLSLIDHPLPLSMATLRANTPCKADTEIHSLLSAMTDAQPSQESVEKMSHAALLCRKVAIRHPALLIRQLPMLGWMLRGRAHIAPSEFRNRNHKQVFINTFVLLDLLQPIVFQDSQVEALESCLEPFFDFLKHQCLESKKYQSVVTKFSDFLVQYAQHNRVRAAAVISRHLKTLEALSEVHSTKKSSLKSLVECFPQRVGGVAGPSPTPPPPSAAMMLVPPMAVGPSLTHEQVMPFLRKMERGQPTEDVLKVLQDLDETSLHSVEILKHFVPELCRVMQGPEASSCRLAHSLLLRHLKQSPRSVDELVPAFVSCLESHDHFVAMAAVSSVPDLTLLCKAEDARLLLTKLFHLATQFTFSCTSVLLKAIEACQQHTYQ